MSQTVSQPSLLLEKESKTFEIYMKKYHKISEKGTNIMKYNQEIVYIIGDYRESCDNYLSFI